MVDIVLAGSGGMLPLPNRWLSCCWIEYMGKALLIDCGEGTQIALKKVKCALSRLDLLLITHFHADHTAGLPGLLLSLGNYGKTTPLIIAGPERITEVVRSLLIIAPVLPFPVEFIIFGEDNRDAVFNDIIISALPLRHGMPCLGYSVSVKRKPVFNPQKAEAFNIPKNLYKVLHNKQDVMLPDGRIITPDMVLDGDRKGYKICYITDTAYFNGLAGFATDSDVLISEGMYGDEEMKSKLTEKGHMTFSDSAGIAKKANAGRLILTHFSPALVNPHDFLDTAKNIFPNTEIGYDGMRISI